jgi:hypothetical protein
MFERISARKRKANSTDGRGNDSSVSENNSVKRRRTNTKYSTTMDLTLLLSLPEEIIFHVLSYLAQPDLIAFGQTNKAMHAMVADISTDMTFKFRSIHELRCQAINALFERQLFDFLKSLHDANRRKRNFNKEKAILARLYKDIYGDNYNIKNQLNPYKISSSAKVKVPDELINNIANILQSFGRQFNGEEAIGFQCLANDKKYYLLARYFYNQLNKLNVKETFETVKHNCMARLSINGLLSASQFNELYNDIFKLQLARLGYQFKRIYGELSRNCYRTTNRRMLSDKSMIRFIEQITALSLGYTKDADILQREFYKLIVILLVDSKAKEHSMFDNFIKEMGDNLPLLKAQLLPALTTDDYSIVATQLYSDGYLTSISPASTKRSYKAFYIQAPSYEPQNDPKLKNSLLIKYSDRYKYLTEDELIRKMTKLADADVGTVKNYSIKYEAIASCLSIIANYKDIYSQFSNRQLTTCYHSFSLANKHQLPILPLILNSIKKVASDRGLSTIQLEYMKDELIEDFKNYFASNLDDDEIFTMLAKFQAGSNAMDSERLLKVEALKQIIIERSKNLREDYTNDNRAQLMANISDLCPELHLSTPVNENRAKIITHATMTGSQKLRALAVYDILLMESALFLRSNRAKQVKQTAPTSETARPSITLKR